MYVYVKKYYLNFAHIELGTNKLIFDPSKC